ncbi:hypothetical protein PAXRUDRAFT_19941 [Paxillus rubicundulus Ve08.2h10]|uniref:Uncharacterized protein n=1 Tax=Paxillus rubicundulus Ve08.2h10 TaxID=930991 RepID=A0A0D0BSG0_9AGAM|nr:hypothetical protein PAXRUDRAFT_19941 [Paxillus rubicundulus Ve08.2h10]
MSRSEHVDHINHDMWQGDTVVRNCNLESAWLDGRAAALSILSASPLWEEEYDFNTIFSIEVVDMLCPFGGGKYPSINHEDDGEDRSMIMLLESEVPPQVPAQTSDDDITAEEEPMLTFEDQLESELANSIIDEDLPTPLSLINPESSTDSSPPPPPSGKGICPLDYLLYKGKWVHKASICRLILNKDFSAKSHDRLFELKFSWIWTGAYLKTASTVPGLKVTTQKVVEVSTTGSLMELINPDVVSASTHLGDDKRKEINKPLLPHAKQTDWQPAIWRYNMEQHFNFAHPEYPHPGKLHGLPLPSNIIPSIIVDSREEAKFSVPFCPQFTHIQIVGEHDEAEPAHKKRRTTNANGITQAGSSKHLCTM